MAKVPISELPIHVYRPLDPSRKCRAYIGELPIRFTGETPMKVRNAAMEWLREEQAKEEARKAAREKRQNALAKARTAGKQEDA